jgi:hypothetical protein
MYAVAQHTCTKNSGASGASPKSEPVGAMLLSSFDIAELLLCCIARSNTHSMCIASSDQYQQIVYTANIHTAHCRALCDCNV